MKVQALDIGNLVAVVGSAMAIIGVVIALFVRLDTRIDRVGGRIDRVDSKVDAVARDVVDVKVAIARIEGFLRIPDDFVSPQEAELER